MFHYFKKNNKIIKNNNCILEFNYKRQYQTILISS